MNEIARFLLLTLTASAALFAQEENHDSTPSSPESSSFATDSSTIESGMSQPEDSGQVILSQTLQPQPPVVRLLITRPNRFGFSKDAKSAWVAPLIETFLYLRLSQIEPVRIVPFETVRSNLPDVNDYRRHITIQGALQALRSVKPNAYLSSEYESTAEGKFHVSLRLAAVGQRTPLHECEVEFDLARMEDSLTSAVQTLVGGVTSAGWSLPFKSSGPVLSSNAKTLQRTGELLIKGLSANPRPSATALEKIYRDDNLSIVALFGAVQLFRLASAPNEALSALQVFTAGRASASPMLALIEGELLRELNRAEDAKSTLSRLEQTLPSYLVLPERVRIEEALGNLSTAREMYTKILRDDESDPEPHRGLARLSLLDGNAQEAKNHLSAWASITSRSTAAALCDLGVEFAQKNRIEAAISAFSACVEDSAGNADGWLALGKALEQHGHHGAAAECYLKLFDIDYVRFRTAPLTAGRLFEQTGFDDRARKAYEQVLSRRRGDPDATIRLAALDKKAGNCDSVSLRLKPLVASGYSDSAMSSLLSQCGASIQDNAVVSGSDADHDRPAKKSRWVAVKNTISISLGLLSAAALAGGIYFNSDIVPLHEQYSGSADVTEVNRLHDKLDDTRTNRNRLYIASSILAAGFGLTILLPGR